MAKLYETINAENWVKRPDIIAYTAYTGPTCLGLWGQRVYSEKEGKWVEAYDKLTEVIQSLYPERVGRYPIPDFNDHPDTTVEDVIRVCKVADV